MIKWQSVGDPHHMCNCTPRGVYEILKLIFQWVENASFPHTDKQNLLRKDVFSIHFTVWHFWCTDKTRLTVGRRNFRHNQSFQLEILKWQGKWHLDSISTSLASVVVSGLNIINQWRNPNDKKKVLTSALSLGYVRFSSFTIRYGL